MSTVQTAHTIDDNSACLEHAVALWRAAQVLHESPAWQGQPEARGVAEEIAAKHPDCESALVAFLQDECALVVSYALLTLDLLGSVALKNLPVELLSRRSKVTLVDGSFKTSMDVGGLARRIQKRAAARLAAQPKS